MPRSARPVSSGYAPKSARPASDEPGVGEAAVRGPLDYLTRGWADEGVGALESTFPRLALSPGDFFDPSVPTPAPRTYEQARDNERATMEATKEAAPGTYHGAGITALMLAPGPKSTGTLGGAVALGAGEGAVAGLGASTDTTGSGQAMDALKGGAMGGAAGAALHGVVRGAQALRQRVAGAADNAEGAVRAAEAERLAQETAAQQEGNRRVIQDTRAHYEDVLRRAQQRADARAQRGMATREEGLVRDVARDVERRAAAADPSAREAALRREAEDILAKAEARAGQEASTYASTHRNLLSTYMDSGRALPEGAEAYAGSVYDDAARRVAERASEGSFDPGRVYNQRLDAEIARAAETESRAAQLAAQPRPQPAALAQEAVANLTPGPAADDPVQALIRNLLRQRGITSDPASVTAPAVQGGNARIPVSRLKPRPEGTVESRTAEALERGRVSLRDVSPLTGAATALGQGNLFQAATRATSAPAVARMATDPAARAAGLRMASNGLEVVAGLRALQGINPEKAATVASRLNAALQRGEDSYKATHYVLQQQDPEYRQSVQQARAEDLSEEELRMLGVSP